jgi:hypothetical protein
MVHAPGLLAPPIPASQLVEPASQQTYTWPLGVITATDNRSIGPKKTLKEAVMSKVEFAPPTVGEAAMEQLESHVPPVSANAVGPGIGRARRARRARTRSAHAADLRTRCPQDDVIINRL